MIKKKKYNPHNETNQYVVIMTRAVGKIITTFYTVIDAKGWADSQRLASYENPGWITEDAMPYILADGHVEDLDFQLTSEEIDKKAGTNHSDSTSTEE